MWLSRLLIPLAFALPLLAQQKIRIAVKADDMAAAHGFNVGTIMAYQNGVVRNTDIIVPGPWLLDAISLLNANPGLDAGIHLALTSEWTNIKWRPLTNAPSLVDQDGYFFPSTGRNPRFPAGHSVLEAKLNMDEVEKELRAQIELARRLLPRISFLSAHMGAVRSSAPLRALTDRLALEYGLPFFDEIPGVARLDNPYEGTDDANVKAQKLAKLFASLTPGDYWILDHAAILDDETKAIGHPGYERVAQDRWDNVQAWSDPRVMRVIKEKGIELITIKQLILDHPPKSQ